MQSGVRNEFLMAQAAEERARANILVCYLKLFTHGKLLVAAFVAVFFLCRVWTINMPGEWVLAGGESHDPAPEVVWYICSIF